MDQLVCEFAVDPDAIDGWQTLRFLDSNFGWERGRMISHFPRKWERMVYEKLQGGLVQDQKVEICLQSLKRKLIRLGRPKELQHGDWLNSAKEEHKRDPFRAIITRENKNRDPFILPLDDLHDGVPCWKVPTDAPIPRTAEDLADVVAHILKHAVEFLLIDPYFDPTKARYRRPLQEICRVARNPNQAQKTITYHLKADGNTGFFEQDCLREVPILVPTGWKVNFFLWNERAGGQSFHDRFLCFKYGVISFGHGLDENRHANDIVNVRLLSEDARLQRLRECDPATSPFDLVHHFRLEGTR